jgi:chromodomain-helicase-DNA-binding protein 1
MDEAATKEELRPVKKQLKQLKLSGEDMPRDDKVAILKESLAAIGRRIDVVLSNKAERGEDCERWRKHLWTYVPYFIPSPAHNVAIRFVTLFWPKKVKASKLEEIHAKMVLKEVRDGMSSDAHIAKKSRPSSSSVKPNGSPYASSSSSMMKSNGKHR